MPADFEDFVASVPSREGPFRPFAHLDREGDCLEFFASNEIYHARRIDSLMTVYIGERSGRIIGLLIEGVAQLLGSASRQSMALFLAFSAPLLAAQARSIPPETVTGALVWESGMRGEDGGYALLVPHPTPWSEVDRYHLTLAHARGRDTIAARLDRLHALGIAVTVTVTGQVVSDPRDEGEFTLIVERCLTRDP